MSKKRLSDVQIFRPGHAPDGHREVASSEITVVAIPNPRVRPERAALYRRHRDCKPDAQVPHVIERDADFLVAFQIRDMHVRLAPAPNAIENCIHDALRGRIADEWAAHQAFRECATKSPKTLAIGNRIDT